MTSPSNTSNRNQEAGLHPRTVQYWFFSDDSVARSQPAPLDSILFYPGTAIANCRAPTSTSSDIFIRFIFFLFLRWAPLHHLTHHIQHSLSKAQSASRFWLQASPSASFGFRLSFGGAVFQASLSLINLPISSAKCNLSETCDFLDETLRDFFVSSSLSIWSLSSLSL
jgi:hypothetical protein